MQEIFYLDRLQKNSAKTWILSKNLLQNLQMCAIMTLYMCSVSFV